MAMWGCGFIEVKAGTGDWVSVSFQTPINLSAWANTDGTANRKAKETMQAITLTHVLIEPALDKILEKQKA